MSIYSPRSYRKIYEHHFGPIPKDENGYSYEIHHIDGDHSNSDITNLKLVTIQEHYKIHHAQEDWLACLLMSKRMKLDPSEKSRLCSAANQKRVLDGTHHFLSGEISRRTQAKRVAEGTHNLQDKVKSKERANRLVSEGKHNFVFANPGQIGWTCLHCNSQGKGASNYNRWHGNKCRARSKDVA